LLVVVQQSCAVRQQQLLQQLEFASGAESASGVNSTLREPYA
jgi:hypothetical protein